MICPSTTRIHGRKIYTPTTPDERIAAFRELVKDGSYAKIDGYAVDLFSANYVVQVYDALNPDNQQKYAAMDAKRMVVVAFQLTKKVGA